MKTLLILISICRFEPADDPYMPHDAGEFGKCFEASIDQPGTLIPYMCHEWGLVEGDF